MQKKVNLKSTIIIITLFILLNIFLAVFLHGFNTASAETGENNIVTETVLENALKTGKFYLNGDTSASYFEVYDDGTLQWHDFDFVGYLTDLNKKHDEETGFVPSEELKMSREKGIKEESEWLSGRHSYSVIQYSLLNSTTIELDYDPSAQCRRGYDYIDENTIKVSDNLCFYYVKQ